MTVSHMRLIHCGLKRTPRDLIHFSSRETTLKMKTKQSHINFQPVVMEVVVESVWSSTMSQWTVSTKSAFRTSFLAETVHWSEVMVAVYDWPSSNSVLAGGIFLNIAGSGWNPEGLTRCPNSPTPTTSPCRLFYLLNITYSSNTAEFGAGGLFISQPEIVLVGCPSEARNDFQPFLTAWNSGQLQESHCTVFDGNSVVVLYLYE